MARPVRTDLDLLNVSRIVNLPDPSAAQHPATKAYVDSLVEGLAWKDNCRVATQSNVNLASPGATIDGVTMQAGDRVLVKAQTTAAANGIYIWNGAATPATRAGDASTAAELENAVTTVDEGTDADASFRQTEINFTLDTNDVLWVAFGTAVPDASESTAGKIEIADQTETDAGADDSRAITPEKLANWSGRKRKHTSTFGDNSSTSYTITHNFGTKDVLVEVYETGGNERQVECEMRHNNVNSIDLLFSAAVATNALRAVIMG